MFVTLNSCTIPWHNRSCACHDLKIIGMSPSSRNQLNSNIRSDVKRIVNQFYLKRVNFPRMRRAPVLFVYKDNGGLSTFDKRTAHLRVIPKIRETPLDLSLNIMG